MHSSFISPFLFNSSLQLSKSSFLSLIGVTHTHTKREKKCWFKKTDFPERKKTVILRFKQKLKMASSEHNEVRYLITNNWKLVMHFVSRESKSLCYKADRGVQSPFTLSVSQPLCKKYKTLPLCCQATMTLPTSKDFHH